jgi:hypothetical protein
VWPLNVSPAATDTAHGFLVRDFEGGQMSRDMTLYVDGDGRAYQIYASEENHTLHISQLTDDAQRPAGRYVRVAPLGNMRPECVPGIPAHGRRGGGGCAGGARVLIPSARTKKRDGWDHLPT